MFNVDEQIRQWRRELNNAEVCHASDLEELEIHLRDEIKNLGDKGLSNEEAFVVASRRLGDKGSLTREFAKVNSQTLFIRRMLWICVGVLASLLIPKLCATVAHVTALGAIVWGMTQFSLNILIPVIQIVTLIISFLTVIYVVRRHCDPSTPPIWRIPQNKKTSLFVMVALADLAVLLLPVLLTMVTARYFGIQDLGRVSLAKMYVNALSPAVISLVAIGLLFKLASSRRRPEMS